MAVAGEKTRPVEAASVSLRRELRRLRAEVLRLEEDKRVLEERVAFLGRELEETRAKIPRGLSTS